MLRILVGVVLGVGLTFGAAALGAIAVPEYKVTSEIRPLTTNGTLLSIWSSASSVLCAQMDSELGQPGACSIKPGTQLVVIKGPGGANSRDLVQLTVPFAASVSITP